MRPIILLGAVFAAPALAANPAINTSAPCNSSQVMFMPTSSGDGVAYMSKLPGAGKVAARGDGTYVVDFGSPDAVNALFKDLNANHGPEIIDRFQFVQCNYSLVPQR